jgi:hypothetical protein
MGLPTATVRTTLRLERSSSKDGADDMGQDQPHPEDDGPAADASRSGKDVVQGVERAALGTPDGGVQTPPEQAKSHSAPVEQVRGDPAMTEGQVVDGPGSAADEVPDPDPAASGSGGAQSVVGARTSDREAARDGEPAQDRPDSPQR